MGVQVRVGVGFLIMLFCWLGIIRLIGLLRIVGGFFGGMVGLAMFPKQTTAIFVNSPATYK